MPLGPIQIGLPELPPSGSDLHVAVMRSWLQDCDNHHKCQPRLSNESRSVTLPTRLIDVGTEDDDETLKLYETQPDDIMRYIALSHPWGPEPHFCTYPENIDEYKRTINFSRLPATFQDAVTITRALGHRYIWIDSLCIIQGPNGDFNAEAKRMENVFSSAYCVLAASAAQSQVDGFLKERDAREYLTMEREGKPPFYICRFIDDFNQHVLEGSLNKRGWVLQERALAHRTIYFTSKYVELDFRLGTLFNTNHPILRPSRFRICVQRVDFRASY